MNHSRFVIFLNLMINFDKLDLILMHIDFVNEVNEFFLMSTVT
jgi:hypothetical protein